MKVYKFSENGYEEAMIGISLSWASNAERAKEIAPKLAHKHGGHNKFTESIMVWLDVDAPRYWWSEMDTYRVGITKQSESTMHTIAKRKLVQDDFEGYVNPLTITYLNVLIDRYQKEGEDKGMLLRHIKQNLPEGFLQRRIICLSYKTLQNIYHQRKNHRLVEWHTFLEIVNELDHPEFIIE